jgi:hypothetical protein
MRGWQFRINLLKIYFVALDLKLCILISFGSFTYCVQTSNNNPQSMSLLHLVGLRLRRREDPANSVWLPCAYPHFNASVMG